MLIDVWCCLVLMRLIVYCRFVHLLLWLLLVVERLFDGCLMSMLTVYISFPLSVFTSFSWQKLRIKRRLILKEIKCFRPLKRLNG